MWPRTALNDVFHSNSAFSKLTELICLLGPSRPQDIKHIESNCKSENHLVICNLNLECYEKATQNWHVLPSSSSAHVAFAAHNSNTALEGEQKTQVRTKQISPPPLPPVSSANEAPLPCTLSKAAGSLARLLFRSSSGSSSLSVLWASKGSASKGSPGFVPPVPDPAKKTPASDCNLTRSCKSTLTSACRFTRPK